VDKHALLPTTMGASWISSAKRVDASEHGEINSAHINAMVTKQGRERQDTDKYLINHRITQNPGGKIRITKYYTYITLSWNMIYTKKTLIDKQSLSRARRSLFLISKLTMKARCIVIPGARISSFVA
jgi:hypothetical protein